MGEADQRFLGHEVRFEFRQSLTMRTWKDTGDPAADEFANSTREARRHSCRIERRNQPLMALHSIPNKFRSAGVVSSRHQSWLTLTPVAWGTDSNNFPETAYIIITAHENFGNSAIWRESVGTTGKKGHGGKVYSRAWRRRLCNQPATRTTRKTCGCATETGEGPVLRLQFRRISSDPQILSKANVWCFGVIYLWL
jgi:hypothetical protein